AGTLTEAAANDGSVTGSITATLAGDTYTSTVVSASHVSATNVPAGLTASLVRTSATVITLTLTGTANAHANANDVSNLTITFSDGAFTNEDASTVTGASKADIGIDFTDASTITWAGTLTEAAANDGSVTGSITATLTGDTYTSTVVSAPHVTVSNVPAGLTASLVRTSATVVTLTLTGTANVHANANDVSNLTVTFSDGAFTTGPASGVSGSTRNDLTINFRDASPEITKITIHSNPLNLTAQGGTYLREAVIAVQVFFNRSLRITGRPQLALQIGNNVRNAGLISVGNSGGVRESVLMFNYTVQSDDADTDGISISANSVRLNEGTINDASDSDVGADLTHSAIAASPRHKVDGSMVPTPEALWVRFATSPNHRDPGMNTGTYSAGEKIVVDVGFDYRVDVSGMPRVALTIGTATRYAVMEGYQPGSTKALRFVYTVQASDMDTDGADIPANALQLNGGTITLINNATANANLAHDAVIGGPGHKVDGTLAPILTLRTFYVNPGAGYPVQGDTYRHGETIIVTAHFDGQVGVIGMPRVAITIGTRTRHAVFVRVTSNGTDAFFKYNVQADDLDTDGIDIAVNALDLNGGDIFLRAQPSAQKVLVAQVSGWDSSDPGHDNHKVNGSLVSTSPMATSVALLNPLPAANNTYSLGERIWVGVSFNNDIAVTGTPQIGIQIGSNLRQADFNRVFWTGRWLIFAYTIQAGDLDADGVSIPANALMVNGGSIHLEWDSSINAVLDHAEVPTQASRKVDGSIKGAPKVSSIRITNTPSSGVYETGDMITVRIGFNRAVDVTGTPRVGLTIGTETRYAITGAASAVHSAEFSYTVQMADLDTDGMSIAANALELNGGTIRLVGSSDPAYDAVLDHESIADSYTNRVNVSTGGSNASKMDDSTPMLAVADAHVYEMPDAQLKFEVTLGRAVSGTVMVDYATSDGTAVAGQDYIAVSGTLTFAPGERLKSISVTVLDDVIDEGEETLVLLLANATGARIADAEGVGTIKNSDPLQKMWLSHFGRMVADHVTDAVAGRLTEPPANSRLTFGGQRIGNSGKNGWAVAWPVNRRGIGGDLLGGVESHPMQERDLLLSSDFHVATRKGDLGGPVWTAWGRASASGFKAVEGGLGLDGDVVTGVLGTDATMGRWLAGVALSVSRGVGEFAKFELDEGTVRSTVTGVHPYVRVSLNERVQALGLVGYGVGDMTINQVLNGRRGGMPIRTDVSMRLGAVGLRGKLKQASKGSWMDLSLRTDAFLTRIAAEKAKNTAATQADASRIRLMLESRRSFQVGEGTALALDLDLGLRHDGGASATGLGVALGGGIGYIDASLGLTVEASTRFLVAHQASGYEEWGVSGYVHLDPGAARRGLSLSLTPSVGTASNTVDQLWSWSGVRAPFGMLGAATRLVETETGYGFNFSAGHGVATPYTRLTVAEGGEQTWRAGVRILLGQNATLEINGIRDEIGGDDPEYALELQGTLRPW
ncbi:MAG: hypothetical protein OXI38_12685, partial [Bacteroidota bacterium]|nr:hypothetical protein [Bacteroidota bacterium]